MGFDRVDLYDSGQYIPDTYSVSEQQQIEMNNPLNLSMSEMFFLENNWVGRTIYNNTIGVICIWNGLNWVNQFGDVVYDIIFRDDFESGDLSKWSIVNSDVNKWVVGVSEKNCGSFSMYISNDDGYSSSYTATCSNISHAYIDVNIPSGVKDVRIRFTWKCEGEISKDYMDIYNTPIGITPSSDNEIDDIYEIGIGDHSDNYVWKEDIITLDNSNVGDRRIVFSWINDTSTSSTLGACVDNINIEYIK